MMAYLNHRPTEHDSSHIHSMYLSVVLCVFLSFSLSLLCLCYLYMIVISSCFYQQKWSSERPRQTT